MGGLLRIFARNVHWSPILMNSFSRFPVPDVKSLPDDVGSAMETTEEKVWCRFLLFDLILDRYDKEETGIGHSLYYTCVIVKPGTGVLLDLGDNLYLFSKMIPSFKATPTM